MKARKLLRTTNKSKVLSTSICKPVSVRLPRLATMGINKRNEKVENPKIKRRRRKRLKQNSSPPKKKTNSKNTAVDSTAATCEREASEKQKADMLDLLKNLKQPYVKLERIDLVIQKLAQSLARAIPAAKKVQIQPTAENTIETIETDVESLHSTTLPIHSGNKVSNNEIERSPSITSLPSTSRGNVQLGKRQFTNVEQSDEPWCSKRRRSVGNEHVNRDSSGSNDTDVIFEKSNTGKTEGINTKSVSDNKSIQKLTTKPETLKRARIDTYGSNSKTLSFDSDSDITVRLQEDTEKTDTTHSKTVLEATRFPKLDTVTRQLKRAKIVTPRSENLWSGSDTDFIDDSDQYTDKIRNRYRKKSSRKSAQKLKALKFKRVRIIRESDSSETETEQAKEIHQKPISHPISFHKIKETQRTEKTLTAIRQLADSDTSTIDTQSEEEISKKSVAETKSPHKLDASNNLKVSLNRIDVGMDKRMSDEVSSISNNVELNKDTGQHDTASDIRLNSEPICPAQNNVVNSDLDNRRWTVVQRSPLRNNHTLMQKVNRSIHSDKDLLKKHNISKELRVFLVRLDDVQSAFDTQYTISEFEESINKYTDFILNSNFSLKPWQKSVQKNTKKTVADPKSSKQLSNEPKILNDTSSKGLTEIFGGTNFTPLKILRVALKPAINLTSPSTSTRSEGTSQQTSEGPQKNAVTNTVQVLPKNAQLRLILVSTPIYNTDSSPAKEVKTIERSPEKLLTPTQSPSKLPSTPLRPCIEEVRSLKEVISSPTTPVTKSHKGQNDSHQSLDDEDSGELVIDENPPEKVEQPEIASPKKVTFQDTGNDDNVAISTKEFVDSEKNTISPKATTATSANTNSSSPKVARKFVTASSVSALPTKPQQTPHKKVSKPPKESHPVYKCIVCDLHFDDYSILQQHLTIHSQKQTVVEPTNLESGPVANDKVLETMSEVSFSSGCTSAVSAKTSQSLPCDKEGTTTASVSSSSTSSKKGGAEGLSSIKKPSLIIKRAKTKRKPSLSSNICSVCKLTFDAKEQLAEHIFSHTQLELQEAFKCAKQKIRDEQTQSKGLTEKIKEILRSVTQPLERSKNLDEVATGTTSSTVETNREIAKDPQSSCQTDVTNRIPTQDSENRMLEPDKIQKPSDPKSRQQVSPTGTGLQNAELTTTQKNVEANEEVVQVTKPITLCECHRTVVTDPNCLRIEVALLCHVCHVLFRSMECFETHYRLPANAHCNKKRLTGRSPKLLCSTCELTFSSVQDVRQHLEVHARYQRYCVMDFRCNICKVIFIGIGSLFYIHWSHHMKNPCFIASRLSFPKNSVIDPSVTLRNQIASTTMRNRLSNDPADTYLQVAEHICSNCRVPFGTETELTRHEPICSNNEKTVPVSNSTSIRLICTHCNISVTDISLFTEHAKTKHDQGSKPQYYCVSLTPIKKAYVCRACVGLYGDMTVFEEHWSKNHVMREQFVCSHCKRDYNNWKSFQDHVEEHKCGTGGSSLYCNVVYKQFEFTCKACNVGFESQKALNHHAIIHQVNNPFMSSKTGQQSTVENVEKTVESMDKGMQSKSHENNKHGEELSNQELIDILEDQDPRLEMPQTKLVPPTDETCSTEAREQDKTIKLPVENLTTVIAKTVTVPVASDVVVKEVQPLVSTDTSVPEPRRGFLRVKTLAELTGEPAHACPVCEQTFETIDKLTEHSAIHIVPKEPEKPVEPPIENATTNTSQQQIASGTKNNTAIPTTQQIRTHESTVPTVTNQTPYGLPTSAVHVPVEQSRTEQYLQQPKVNHSTFTAKRSTTAYHKNLPPCNIVRPTKCIARPAAQRPEKIQPSVIFSSSNAAQSTQQPANFNIQTQQGGINVSQQKDMVSNVTPKQSVSVINNQGREIETVKTQIILKDKVYKFACLVCPDFRGETIHDWTKHEISKDHLKRREQYIKQRLYLDSIQRSANVSKSNYTDAPVRNDTTNTNSMKSNLNVQTSQVVNSRSQTTMNTILTSDQANSNKNPTPGGTSLNENSTSSGTALNENSISDRTVSNEHPIPCERILNENLSSGGTVWSENPSSSNTVWNENPVSDETVSNENPISDETVLTDQSTTVQPIDSTVNEPQHYQMYQQTYGQPVAYMDHSQTYQQPSTSYPQQPQVHWGYQQDILVQTSIEYYRTLLTCPQNAIDFSGGNVYQVAAAQYQVPVAVQPAAYICPLCPETLPFPTEDMLQFHMNTNHNYSCEICGHRFYNYTDLTMHKMEHCMIQRTM